MAKTKRRHVNRRPTLFKTSGEHKGQQALPEIERAIKECEAELEANKITVPQRPSEKCAKGKLRNLKSKHLTLLKNLCQTKLGIMVHRPAKPGGARLGSAHAKVTTAAKMDQAIVQEALQEAKRGRHVRSVHVSASETARVDGTAVLVADKKVAALKTDRKTGKTYHTPETLKFAARVEPATTANGADYVEVKMEGKREAEMCILFYAPPHLSGAAPGPERARNCHLIYELPGGYVVEVVTSTRWYTAILGNYAGYVHSTPLAPVTDPNFGVLKLVPYIQGTASRQLAHVELATVSAVRDDLCAQKSAEFKAVAQLQAQAEAMAAARNGAAFSEHDVDLVVAAYAAATNGSGHVKVETDEKTASKYWPLGWGARPQGHKGAARKPLVFGSGVHLNPLYLRNSTYDHATGAIHDAVKDAVCGAAGILGHAASLIATAWPDALFAAFKLCGGNANASKFAFPPAAMQAALGGGAAGDAPWLSAWHCAQLGIRWGGANVHGMVEQASSARHTDSGDAKHSDARKHLALLLYAPHCVAAPPCAPRTRSAQ